RFARALRIGARDTGAGVEDARRHKRGSTYRSRNGERFDVRGAETKQALQCIAAYDPAHRLGPYERPARRKAQVALVRAGRVRPVQTGEARDYGPAARGRRPDLGESHVSAGLVDQRRIQDLAAGDI